jgi:hypothetical protein
MSHTISTKAFTKISELDEAVGFNIADEFVVVNDAITQKITGHNLTASIVLMGNLATKTYVDAVVDSAPELLNTLNELAAALNDDANFATTITALIGTKLASSDFPLSFDNSLAGKTTSNLVEGDNLYWTQARFDEALGFKSTSDTAEGSNLYYTQARFDTALAAKTTSDITEGVNLYYTEQRVLDVINSLPPDPADRLINGSIEVILQSDGTVILPADPISNNHAATKGYVDSQLNSIESFSGSYNDLTDKPTTPTYTSVTTTDLNVRNVNFTGSGPVTYTSGNDLNFVAAGVITFNSAVSLGTDGKLTLLAEPTSANHATTKLYVDNLVNTIVTGSGYATTSYVAQEIEDANLDGGTF